MASRIPRAWTAGRGDGHPACRARPGLTPSATAYDRAVTREEWLRERTYDGAAVDATEVAARKRESGLSVSVVLPALNVAGTVGAICAAIRETWMGPAGLVDEIVVVDSRSSDETARLAAEAGARVVQDTEILPHLGAGSGKGEAMWKSLAATRGDMVVWIDADIEDFDPAFVPGLLHPLFLDGGIGYVKALYRRPLGAVADDGGRVTEICARPLLNRFCPPLAAFVQPLSGEAAGRRTVLERTPFFTGYAVEIGLLLDLLGTIGLEGMAQVDLGVRRHRNQPTVALGRMAYEITQAVLSRAVDGPAAVAPPPPYARPVPRDGGYVLEQVAVGIRERPPMAQVTRT